MSACHALVGGSPANPMLRSIFTPGVSVGTRTSTCLVRAHVGIGDDHDDQTRGRAFDEKTSTR